MKNENEKKVLDTEDLNTKKEENVNNLDLENKIEENYENEDEYYEEDETKRRYPPFILLILITTMGVVGALGFSFSSVKYLESNETINTIISNIKGNDNKDKYIITYVENTGEYESGINLYNQFPTPDSKGKLFTGNNYVYVFSLIVGKKTEGAYYELTAVPDKSNNLKESYAKLYLEKNGRAVEESLRKDNKVKVFTEYSESEYEGTEGKVIYKGTITKEDIKKGRIDFIMRMWVSEDAVVDSNYNNKKFAVRVNTYATFLEG